MTAPADRLAPGGRISRWLARWGPVLPLLGAEFVLLLGFGAVLPVLPLYLMERGVDIPTLGLIVAAWPATRLVAEPAFGWLADRTRRPPLMVAGLVLSAAFATAPLLAEGAVAFIILRGLAGGAAALYDPAARGYLLDVTPPDRRGEAFGLYSAAQMAGFIFGPAVGGLAAAVTGDVRSVFILSGAAMLVSAIVVAIAVREVPDRRGNDADVARTPEADGAHARALEPPSAVARVSGVAPVPSGPADHARTGQPIRSSPHPAAGTTATSHAPGAPASLWNRLLLAAIALNFGNYFAGGTWEVIWSLYMHERGANLEFIGLTFAAFGLPILILSPLVGRLVDRRGPVVFIVVGSLAAVVTSLLYTVIHDLPTIALIVIVEGAGWALVTPALYAIVARGTPAGRSSTTQGIYGSSGTLANITASVLAGQMFAMDRNAPFHLIAVVVSLSLVASLLIGGRPVLRRPPRRVVGQTADVVGG